MSAPAETSFKMPPKRGADLFLRRVRRLPTYRNLSGICRINAKQMPASVGMVIDHPQNDGRYRYRKREIGIQCFCHADEHCSSLRKCFVSSTNMVRYQTLCRGSTKALPYKSAETFIECHPNAKRIKRPSAGRHKCRPLQLLCDVYCRGGARSSRNVCQDAT